MTDRSDPFTRRRATATLAASAALAALGPRAARGQGAWPARPIRLVVPFPAGGGADVAARLVAARAAERLGQPITIENRPGGNTLIGVQEVMRAPADGYALLWTLDQTFVLNPALYQKLPYDPQRDFAPVLLAIGGPISLVTRADSGIGSVQELVGRARAQPDKVNAGSAAILAHVALELVNRAAGTRMTRVTYKGSADVAQGTMAGDIDVAFDGIAPYLPYVRQGRARALAVTSARRAAALPDTPTLAEAGLGGIDLSVWFALVGPAGLPADVTRRLAQAFTAALAERDVIERLATFGFEPIAGGPEALAARIDGDLKRYAPIVRDLGLKLD